MKQYIFFIAMICIIRLEAQSSTDALRYSNLPTLTATGRTIGIGGAIGALGGDFSSTSINPAGIATYRSSEFTFSPGFYNATTSALLRSNNGSNLKNEDRFDKLNISNIGLVLASGGNEASNSNWKTSNFAIGFNRIGSLSSNFYYTGNSANSVAHSLEEQANINGLDDFSTLLAYNAGAIFIDSAQGKYVSDFTGINTKNFKTQSVSNRGSANEIVFNYAANYKDKLSIGFTFGVPILRFEQTNIYSEQDVDGTIPFFNSLNYNQTIISEAAGINLKAGFIYRANQMLRLGLAYHSPTFYGFSDQYNSNFTYNYTSSGTVKEFKESSPDGIFDYKLLTPSKWIGSAAVVIGKKGFISSDIELINHGGNRYSYEGEFKSQENIVNNEIQNRFASTVNIRIGGEYVIDVFRVRAGIGINPSPFKGDNTYNNSYSLGFGVKGKRSFLDFGYRRDKTTQIFKPYSMVSDKSKEQIVDENIWQNNLVLTVGFRF